MGMLYLLKSGKVKYKQVITKEVSSSVKQWNIIIKNTMKYLKRLVENVCGPEQQDDHLLMKRVKLKPPYNASTRTTNSENPPNRKTSLDLQKIRKKCSLLPQTSKGQCAPQIHLTGTKKLLLLDLDKTIIYYSQKDGFTSRPHLKHFLKTIHPFYQIYIFTASTKLYLQQMLKKIQQDGCNTEYFIGFLTRENCSTLSISQSKIIYIKDIRVLTNCHPSKIVVVDDTPITYCLNQDNAVPVLPYSGERFDNDLLFLSETLRQIKDYQDVRDYIRGRYVFNTKSLQTIRSDEKISFKFNASNKPNITLKRHRSQ